MRRKKNCKQNHPILLQIVSNSLDNGQAEKDRLTSVLKENKGRVSLFGNFIVNLYIENSSCNDYDEE